MLKEAMRYIQFDDWYSLPEMTNHNGEYNGFSCRAQAWSVGCVLSALEDVLHLSNSRVSCNSRFTLINKQ